MNLLEIISRNLDPQPWEEGEKIPWDDPDFSRRMLREHLSQEHDAASRRTHIIEKHVDWIHKHILGGETSRILDLGCGPGFYAARLAALGHAPHGIDFSPTSIEYAVKHAPEGCSYALGDIREMEFGSDHDLVMLIFGEFNVFKPDDANLILKKSFDALKPGGKLLLEVSTFDDIYEKGIQPASWYTAEDELFSDEPHLVLMESFWLEEGSVAIERYFVVDGHTGKVSFHSASQQAYEIHELEDMLIGVGFQNPTSQPGLTGNQDDSDELVVLIASK